MWIKVIETKICPNCGRIMDTRSGMPTNGEPISIFRGSCPCGTEVKITINEIFEDGDKATEIFGEVVIL